MLTRWLISLGVTRDSALWFWSRLVSAAAVLGTGLVNLSAYLSPGQIKATQVGAVIVLWLAGKYDSSQLPGEKKEP